MTMLDPGTEEKEFRMSKEQAKQTTDNQKHQKKCRKLKEIQTKGESLKTQLERSVQSLLNVELLK